MRRVPAYLSLAALLLAPAGDGQDTDKLLERLEIFQLFNACRPMVLAVEGLGDDAADIGLTEKDLQAAAESRLRAARLYTEDRTKSGQTYLYVNINVFGPAFNTSIRYNKFLTDEFGRAAYAPTWNTGSIGTHGGTASYIVSVLSQKLDEFLAAYLRVNEEACGTSAHYP